MFWHILVGRFQCVLVQMLSALFISGHTTPPGTVFVTFAELLTQIAEDTGAAEGYLADSLPKSSSGEFIAIHGPLKLGPLLLRSLEGSMTP